MRILLRSNSTAVPKMDVSTETTAFSFVYAQLSTLLDVEYWSWLWWLFKPVMITLLLPCIIYVLLYLSIIILFVYKFRQKIREDVQHDIWQGARSVIALLWLGHAKIYHGYEICGLENIPATGPALVIYYHGALPIDYYYLVAGLILHRKRLLWGVGDRFLSKLPGFKLLMEVMKVTPGSVQSCVETLNNGNMLAIAPGGSYEALFGTHKYQLLWRKRIGFAKIALQAKVPIIPVFTQNIREAFRTFPHPEQFFKKLYLKTRLPLVPIYGGFPVKLRTFIGTPIPYDPNISPEDLAEKTRLAIEDMIQEHQRNPGNILKALADRFDWIPALFKRKPDHEEIPEDAQQLIEDY